MTGPIDMEGPAAPPCSNGELVFVEPWESRAFGMAVTLSEAGVFTWSQFQAALIARIARWESAPTVGWNYYQQWLGALEDVLAGCDTVLVGDVTARAVVLAQRPTGPVHPH